MTPEEARAAAEERRAAKIRAEVERENKAKAPVVAVAATIAAGTGDDIVDDVVDVICSSRTPLILGPTLLGRN